MGYGSHIQGKKTVSLTAYRATRGKGKRWTTKLSKKIEYIIKIDSRGHYTFSKFSGILYA